MHSVAWKFESSRAHKNPDELVRVFLCPLEHFALASKKHTEICDVRPDNARGLIDVNRTFSKSAIQIDFQLLKIWCFQHIVVFSLHNHLYNNNLGYF